MAEYIDRDDVLRAIYKYPDWKDPQALWTSVRKIPTADVAPVHRCRDCIYFEPEHVETPSGEKKAYSEMPACAFDDLGTGLVTSEYGINVGSQCTVDENAVHSVSKAVWRRPDDFCSRWRGAKMDEEVKDG